MTERALGIDLGTTAVKALVADAGGRTCGSASVHYGVHATDRTVEADPVTWRQATLDAVRRLDRELLATVGSIGLSGNMSSVVLLDRHHRPLRPPILLADGRGTEQLAELGPSITRRVAEQAGNAPATVFSLSTLLWLARETPDLLGDGVQWCAAKDWLRAELTGHRGGTVPTDVTDAFNTLLVSPQTRDWDAGLIDDLGIPRHVFPALAPSAEPLGGLAAEIARMTGLRAGTPVITGCGDMAALAVGGGLGTSSDPARLLVSLGTSITALVRAPVTPQVPGPGFTWHPMPDAGSAFALASLVTGGLALNWLRELMPDAANLPCGPLPPDEPLVFVPHLAGSAYPRPRPDVHGAVLGLRISTSWPAIAAALFEALAFELISVLDAVPAVEQVTLTGGGTRVPAWVDAVAESTTTPVSVLAEPDASARGAALLALQAVGVSIADLPPLPAHRVTRAADAHAVRTRRRHRYAAAKDLVFSLPDNTDCDGPTR